MGTGKQYLNTKEVAKLLHVNEKVVYSLVSDKGLPATKVTGMKVAVMEEAAMAIAQMKKVVVVMDAAVMARAQMTQRTADNSLVT